jgi:hypothetical protein
MHMREFLILVLLFVLPVPALASDLPLANRDDVEAMLNRLGEEALREVVAQEPGEPTRDAVRSLKQLERQLIRDEARQPDSEAAAACVPTSISLCLLGRFIVVAVFENPFVEPGVLKVAGGVQLTRESGYMYFLSRTNMEIPIKMVSFCFENPQTIGVFVAGLTNFGVSVGVKDSITGIQINYINDPGHVFNTILRKENIWPC